jgi:hypothetical protein
MAGSDQICSTHPLFLNSGRSIQLEDIEARTSKLVNLCAAVATLSPDQDQEYEHYNSVRCLRKPLADESDGSL